MNWQQQTIERQTLYEQVWAEPMTKVAKKYAMSDVGLRKVCVALDVPLPPRGYWAKLASGTTLPKPALPSTTVATTYSRSRFVPQVDHVMESRLSLAREQSPSPAQVDFPPYSPAPDHTAFSTQAKLVSRAMKGVKLEDGVRTSSGITWADVSVSDELMERALLLVDQFAYELKNIGAEFDNKHAPLPLLRRGMRREPGLKRNCATIREQEIFVRIRERVTKELVPPKIDSDRPRAGRSKPAWEFRLPEYRYIPTGKLQAAIVRVSGYYEWYKLEDTVSSIIEGKVRKAVLWIESDAFRIKVSAEVRAERETERRAKALVWEEKKATKERLLATLTSFEKMSKDLDRAESLRRLRERIVAHASPPADMEGSIELLTLMADWLDPLVKASWPDVDDIGERNPHGTYW